MPADQMLTMGVLATSEKENEFRLPIHPLQLDRIDSDLRERIVLESGYGARFGAHDEQLRERVTVASTPSRSTAHCARSSTTTRPGSVSRGTRCPRRGTR